MASGDGAKRLDRDVDGEQAERHADRLLSSPLRHRRSDPLASEQPHHHAAGQHLDQAVHAEADQCDRTGGETSGHRDRELRHVPGVPPHANRRARRCRRARSAGSRRRRDGTMVISSGTDRPGCVSGSATAALHVLEMLEADIQQESDVGIVQCVVDVSPLLSVTHEPR